MKSISALSLLGCLCSLDQWWASYMKNVLSLTTLKSHVRNLAIHVTEKWQKQFNYTRATSSNCHQLFHPMEANYSIYLLHYKYNSNWPGCTMRSAPHIKCQAAPSTSYNVSLLLVNWSILASYLTHSHIYTAWTDSCWGMAFAILLAYGLILLSMPCTSIHPPWTFPHFVESPTGMHMELKDLFTIWLTQNEYCYETAKYIL